MTKTTRVLKKQGWAVVSAVLVVLLIVSIATSGFNGKGGDCTNAGSADVVGQKAVDYVNENLLSDGSEMVLKGSNFVNGMYVLSLELDGQVFDSYVSPDGTMLFPQAVELATSAVDSGTPQSTPTPQSMPKSDKPVVELFVMSHCPYGTQAEKGIIPVAELLGDKIDFEIKFVYYAMHGEKEVKEQLNQYCIQTEQSDVYFDYMKCFLKDGDSARCYDEVGVDTDALAECYEATDEEYGILASLADKSTWISGSFPPFAIHEDLNKNYGVRGSPTLVLNGVQVSSARDSASYLATICGAFNNAPAECDEELSSASPSPGFGYAATGNTGTATCG